MLEADTMWWNCLRLKIPRSRASLLAFSLFFQQHPTLYLLGFIFYVTGNSVVSTRLILPYHQNGRHWCPPTCSSWPSPRSAGRLATHSAIGWASFLRWNRSLCLTYCQMQAFLPVARKTNVVLTESYWNHWWAQHGMLREVLVSQTHSFLLLDFSLLLSLCALIS